VGGKGLGGGGKGGLVFKVFVWGFGVGTFFGVCVYIFMVGRKGLIRLVWT
jgi:hypothetical protein